MFIRRVDVTEPGIPLSVLSEEGNPYRGRSINVPLHRRRLIALSSAYGRAVLLFAVYCMFVVKKKKRNRKLFITGRATHNFELRHINLQI
jgi:hypothetical protein